MKIIIYLLTILLSIKITLAQAPEKFSFQGVARNAEGKVVASRDVNIRISIRPETALGSPIYQETHTAKTTANGVFNIEVGGGAGLSGQFSSIDWKSGKYFLQLEMDPEGGGSYVDLGTTQLLSVPYAIHAAEANRWKDFDPVIQEGRSGEGASLPELDWANDHKMMWYPRKAAFRFGYWSGQNVWSDTNIGSYSLAGGGDAIASGGYSFAFGDRALADEKSSIAIGERTQAKSTNAVSIGVSSMASGYKAVTLGSTLLAQGTSSVALGEYSQSLAEGSITIGSNLVSQSQYGIVLGVNNDVSDALDNAPEPTRRLFQIGNGDNPYLIGAVRRNALTILRNGNVGIGNNVLAPTHILDVGNRVRLRSNPGATAGLWLDNSDNVPYSFIGGKSNDEAGIYFEPVGWVFSVNKNGTARVANALVQTSDIRLKRNIRPITGSFTKLISLSARHYYWKDQHRSQTLQTGLIAQEVESVFPELVETDKEGYKSVNYIGLIPHLLEAVKELKQENARLSGENQKLASQAENWAAIQKRIEAIEASLVKSQAQEAATK